MSFATFSSPRPDKRARPVYTGWCGAAICSSNDLRMFPGLGLNEVMRPGGSQAIGVSRLSDWTFSNWNLLHFMEYYIRAMVRLRPWEKLVIRNMLSVHSHTLEPEWWTSAEYFWFYFQNLPLFHRYLMYVQRDHCTCTAAFALATLSHQKPCQSVVGLGIYPTLASWYLYLYNSFMLHFNHRQFSVFFLLYMNGTCLFPGEVVVGFSMFDR